MANFILARHDLLGVEKTLPATALRHLDGWVPVEPAEVVPAVAERTVADVLAEVGDDPVKAAAALEAERSGKARKGLIEPLTTIADRQTEES
jgi:hypothetical protein